MVTVVKMKIGVLKHRHHRHPSSPGRGCTVSVHTAWAKKLKVAKCDFYRKGCLNKSEAGGTSHPLTVYSVLLPKPLNNSKHSTQIVLVHVFEAVHYLLRQQRILVLGVLIEEVTRRNSQDVDEVQQLRH